MKKTVITSILSAFVLLACANSNNSVVVKENDKYGTLNEKKELKIKPIYDDVSSLKDRNDRNIKTTHPSYINFHWIHDYKGELYSIVKYQNKYGIVDKDNNMIIKPIYDSISKFYNNIAVIKLDGKYGYINNKFEVVQKPIFKEALEFTDLVTFVKSVSNNKYACIDINMNVKTPFIFDEVYNYVEGGARVKTDGKWGFLNLLCQQVTPYKYDFVYDYSNGYAKVLKNEKITYVNQQGEEISKPLFESGEEF